MDRFLAIMLVAFVVIGGTHSISPTTPYFFYVEGPTAQSLFDQLVSVKEAAVSRDRGLVTEAVSSYALDCARFTYEQVHVEYRCTIHTDLSLEMPPEPNPIWTGVSNWEGGVLSTR